MTTVGRYRIGEDGSLIGLGAPSAYDAATFQPSHDTGPFDQYQRMLRHGDDDHGDVVPTFHVETEILESRIIVAPREVPRWSEAGTLCPAVEGPRLQLVSLRRPKSPCYGRRFANLTAPGRLDYVLGMLRAGRYTRGAVVTRKGTVRKRQASAPKSRRKASRKDAILSVSPIAREAERLAAERAIAGRVDWLGEA